MRLLLLAVALTQLGCGKLLGFDDVTRCEGAECGGGGEADSAPLPTCLGPDDCDDVAAPICDMEQDVCRACGADAECAAIDSAVPACSPGGNCVECIADMHCASEVCDTGSSTCVAEENVIYMAVDGSTDAACGTRADPCKRFVEALAHVAAPRDIVKVKAGTYNGDAPPILVPGSITVTLLAADAVVDLVGAGNTFEIGAGTTFTMRGGTVTGATTGNGFLCADATGTLRLFGTTVSDNDMAGIRCIGTVVLEDVMIASNTGDGVDCTNGANLTITRATITGNDDGVQSADSTTMTESNVFANTELGFHCNEVCDVSRTRFHSNSFGGIEAFFSSGTYVNNVIFENGGGEDGSVGGATFWPDPGETVLFAYNTVYGNHSRSAQAGGVHCVDGDIVSPNNLVQDNLDTDDKEHNFTGPGCNFSYSNIGEIGSNTSNNIDIDPFFINEFHITADASCTDHGNPTGVEDITVDFDGDVRPFGDAPDCGADEFVP